jgi:hypothetical protein
MMVVLIPVPDRVQDMPIVEIRRDADTVGVFRRLIVSCDGEPVARVRRNRSAEVDIGAGPHQFVGSMDWVTSAPLAIDLQEGDHVLLQASIDWTGFTSLLAGLPLFRARSAKPNGMLTLTRIG